VKCCSAPACRSCATKSVTRNKVCWNETCGKPAKTGDLVNDEGLREEVEKFQNAKKEAEAKLKAENEAKENAGKNAKEEENTKKEGGKKKEMTNSKVSEAPPPKKAKPDSELLVGGVSLTKMQERNDEFDRCMLPVERASKELRFGAQLELMLEFGLKHATCLICGEQLMSEFIILKHIQLKHRKEYDQMKSVLGATNINTLNMFLHKAIRSEFLYQKKQVFPIPVNY